MTLWDKIAFDACTPKRAEAGRGHEDPDNSGLCIHCSAALGVAHQRGALREAPRERLVVLAQEITLPKPQHEYTKPDLAEAVIARLEEMEEL